MKMNFWKVHAAWPHTIFTFRMSTGPCHATRFTLFSCYFSPHAAYVVYTLSRVTSAPELHAFHVNSCSTFAPSSMPNAFYGKCNRIFAIAVREMRKWNRRFEQREGGRERKSWKKREKLYRNSRLAVDAMRVCIENGFEWDMDSSMGRRSVTRPRGRITNFSQIRNYVCLFLIENMYSIWMVAAATHVQLSHVPTKRTQFM